MFVVIFFLYSRIYCSLTIFFYSSLFNNDLSSIVFTFQYRSIFVCNVTFMFTNMIKNVIGIMNACLLFDKAF